MGIENGVTAELLTSLPASMLGQPLIAESYANAAAVHELTGHPGLVAFNAGNLGKVAELCRAQHPERAIYIDGATDLGKPSNVGRTKAEEAAAAIDVKALLPVFPDGVKETDWNDMAKTVRRDTTQIFLQAAIRVAVSHILVERSVQGSLSGRPSKRRIEPTIQQVSSNYSTSGTADPERRKRSSASWKT